MSLNRRCMAHQFLIVGIGTVAITISTLLTVEEVIKYYVIRRTSRPVFKD